MFKAEKAGQMLFGGTAWETLEDLTEVYSSLFGIPKVILIKISVCIYFFTPELCAFNVQN